MYREAGAKTTKIFFLSETTGQEQKRSLNKNHIINYKLSLERIIRIEETHQDSRGASFTRAEN